MQYSTGECLDPQVINPLFLNGYRGTDTESFVGILWIGRKTPYLGLLTAPSPFPAICHALHCFKGNLSLFRRLTSCHKLRDESVNHPHYVCSSRAFRMPDHPINQSASSTASNGKAFVLTDRPNHSHFLAHHPANFRSPRSSRNDPTTSFLLDRHQHSLAYWPHTGRTQAFQVNALGSIFEPG
jgi:hypothetical protein